MTTVRKTVRTAAVIMQDELRQTPRTRRGCAKIRSRLFLEEACGAESSCRHSFACLQGIAFPGGNLKAAALLACTKHLAAEYCTT